MAKDTTTLELPIWEAGLNPEQTEAMRHDTGPCVVYACAGTGKTEAMMRRLARLVAEGVDPDRILAVTFSKKGAQEMEERLTKRFGVEGARVGTWHSLCLQILREDRTRMAEWEIDDKNRAKIIMKEVLGYKQMNWKTADLAKVLSFVGLCKASLFDAGSEDASNLAKELFSFDGPRAAEAFGRYQGMLEDKGILTFDDFLVFAARHLSVDEDARSKWAAKWDYVVQDEAQDANIAQNTMGELLARDHRNYTVVGDLAQAIFTWRGGKPELLQGFSAQWNAKTIIMHRNYRSGQKIIDAGNAVIRPATMRVQADMTAERGTDGKVRVVECETFDDEGAEIATEIEQAIIAREAKPSDYFVLFRVNAQSRAIEDKFIQKKIPYVVVGGVSFYERKEVKDLLAYLRVAAGSGELEDVKRCINSPFRFLGPKFVERLVSKAEREGTARADWTALVRAVGQEQGLQYRQRQSVEDWATLIGKVREAVTKGEKPARLLDDVVRMTGYMAYVRQEEGEESIENAAESNVREMVRVAEQFKTAEELLDYIADTTKAARKASKGGGERVVLMSIHKCVSPDTYVETEKGIQRIEDIEAAGVIGTAEGAAGYSGKAEYKNRTMLRLRTKSGYEVNVTEDHGMMVWDPVLGEYVRREAGELSETEFLRLKLGATMDIADAEIPKRNLRHDVRAKVHPTPKRMSSEFAEFLGLMVADGTIYRAGFRLKKRHEDVTRRFAALAEKLFSVTVPVRHERNMYSADINSTYLSKWLLMSVVGLAPNAKEVPPIVLASSHRSQAAFLRGLFEDGTVNVKNGRLDHVAWSTCYPEMARLVQILLLRFGIISSRTRVLHHDGDNVQHRLTIYGFNAHLFRDAIGFVSAYKNGLLQCATGHEEGYIVPVTKDRVGPLRGEGKLFHAIRNANRGYVSRHGAKLIGLNDELRFHHDRIVSIERYSGPAMCVSVPSVGRFLQNGFDGCNSKGLESKHVFVVGFNEEILPHRRGDEEEERRLAYVAMTRARDTLTLTHVRSFVTPKGIKSATPSRFLSDAGLIGQEAQPGLSSSTMGLLSEGCEESSTPPNNGLQA